MNRLRFGLIGLGHFGAHYVRLLGLRPDAQLVAVGSLRSNLKKTSLPPDVAIVDPSRVILDPTVDCVIIATPASTHAAYIAAAMDAGKHVLVEKPMVMNQTEATRVQALVQKHPEQTFMVAFQYVYNDYIRTLRQYCTSGRLGTITYVFAENLYFGPIRNDIGSFGDAGVHELSIIDYLFQPGKIRDANHHHFGVTAPLAHDFVAATITFERGLKAHIVTSWFFPTKTRRMIIVGDRAIAMFDDQEPETKLKIYERPYPGAFPETSSNFMKQLASLPPEIPNVSAHEPLQNELAHFIQCVRENKQPDTGIDFGMRLVEYVETILSSSKEANAPHL